ncbi:MAG: hypothetical protein J5449_06345 [Oscillospiraceae bacterium]|nr:hypothetical protein [Oscillospiraceae bacterium]
MINTVNDGETAAAKDFVRSSGTAAGGLVGRAAMAELENCFAATVVRGKYYAGGLVGSADTLSATRCYADCYIAAESGIGGLAGYIKAGGAFTTCYSAGFILNEGVGAAKAGGFTPSAASVSYGYSVFCYDDAIHLTAKPLPNGSTENVPTPIEGLKKYALVGSGSVSGGYYVYSGVDQEAGAVKLSGEELAGMSISGFEKGIAAANNYLLTGGLTLTENYTYPKLSGLTHYNDFYAVESEDAAKVSLYRVALRGVDPITVSESIHPYSKTNLGDYVYANFYSGVARNEVFVGWLDEDGLAAIKGLSASGRADLCKELDKLTITDASLANGDVKTVFGTVLDYEYEDGRMKISVKDKNIDEDDPKLYALYREITPFEVNVRFMSFDLDSFVETKDADGKPTKLYLDVTAQRYLGGFAIRQDIIYTVNPLIDENYKTDTRVVKNINDIVGKRQDTGESTGYAVVDAAWLLEQYSTTLGQDLSRFKSAAAFTESELADYKKVVTVDPGLYNNTSKTLTVKLDEPRTYVVLCGSGLIDVPVKMIFTDCKVEGGDRTGDKALVLDKSLKDPYKELRDILKNEKTEYKKGTDFTVTYWMKLTPNVVMWSEIPSFESEGFKLDKNDPEKIKNQLILNDKDHVTVSGNVMTYKSELAPVITYDRIFFELAYDLNGGVCNQYLKTSGGAIVTDGSGKPMSNAAAQIDPIEDMISGQKLSEFLPVNDADAAKLSDQAKKYGYMSRPGYKLTGWKFYKLADYGKGNAEEVSRVINESNGLITKEYHMPAYSVIAVAQWSEHVEAPIRVEIYIQNVTDSCNAAAADKTYSFYTAYELSKESNNSVPTVSTYAGYDYNTLLTEVYKKKTNSITLGTDDREYLRDPTEKKSVNGTILNPQIIFNNAKTTGSSNGTNVPYTLDTTGTAVFKLYYDRQKDTFIFESDSGIESARAKKQHFDPGSGSGYVWVSAPYEKNGSYYFDRDWDWDGPVWGHYEYSDPMYLLKDGLIDDYFENNASVDLTDKSNYELATAGRLVDSKYTFVKRVDELGGHYYVPFYDSGDLIAAENGNYKTRIDGVGLTQNGASISGLYEQPLSLAYELAKDDPNDHSKWEWPGKGENGEWNCDWKGYYLNNSGGYTELAGGGYIFEFFSYFYVDRWIDYSSSCGASTIKFKALSSDDDMTVKYYLETDDASGNSTYDTNPAFVWKTTRDDFILDNKYDGYTVCGYKKNGGSFQSASAGYTIQNGWGIFVEKNNNLEIFFKRNSYTVYYNDIRQNQTKTYLYGRTLNYLPDINTGNENDYRPASMSSACHFRGWYTESNGGGQKLEIKNGKVCAVSVDGTETEVTMPSNNLTVFALWTTDEVEVQFYSRVPGLSGEALLLTQEERNAGKVVPTAKVNLYEQIEQGVFADIYSRWAAKAGYNGETITADGKTYEFKGWYRTPGNSVPESDSALKQRFYEQEYVTTPGTFVLAAKWTQKTGMAYYNVRCILLDANGKIVGKPVILEKYDEATVGEPLNVPAPSTVKYPQLEGYYPLKSFAYMEKFDPSENDTVEFYYQVAQSWPYTVRYIAKLAGLPGSTQKSFDMIFMEQTLRTNKEEARVQPVDVEGFILTPDDQAQQMIKKDAAEDKKVATFYYVIDMDSITTATDASWTQGSLNLPKLVTIKNGTENKLESKTENYEVITFYSLQGSATRFDKVSDLLNKGKAGGTMLDAGNYKVSISIELWNSDGQQVIIYTGTADLEVK